MCSIITSFSSQSTTSPPEDTVMAGNLHISGPSYKVAMQNKILQFSDCPAIQQVLQTKVSAIALQRMRLEKAPAIEAEVSADFEAAVVQVAALEEHAFSIKAPPSLSRDNITSPLSANQSIMRHSLRPPKELEAIAKAFNITSPIRGLIPLTTERLVQHNLIRRFILNFCLQGELSEELKKIIKPLTLRLMRTDERFENMCQLRNDLESQAIHYLETRNIADSSPGFIQIIETLEKQARAIDSGLSEQELLWAIAQRASDVTVETYIQSIVDEYDLHLTPELQGYQPLPAQSKATRRTFMINGGVASGKSSAKQLQDEQALREGIDPRTLCSLNRDAFKPMLLGMHEVDPEYREFFASFTEDEAFLLRDAALKEYQDRLKADTAPHLYIDQVSPTIEMLRMAGDPTTCGLDLTIVYSPVETSFVLASLREEATGYGAVTVGLLNSHANVSTQLVDNIEQARKDHKNNIRLRIVANVARGVLAPIASIDYLQEIGQIQNRDLLMKFFHKKHIQREATRFQEIYAPNLPVADQCSSCAPMMDRLINGVVVVLS